MSAIRTIRATSYIEYDSGKESLSMIQTARQNAERPELSLGPAPNQCPQAV